MRSCLTMVRIAPLWEKADTLERLGASCAVSSECSRLYLEHEKLPRTDKSLKLKIVLGVLGKMGFFQVPYILRER